MTRTALGLLFTLSLGSAGCSFLIARSGKDLDELKTRDDFVATFGKPVESCEGEVDVFRTRRKIAQTVFGPGEAMLMCLTLGFSEFLTTPYELYQTAKWTVVGQEIRVVFDSAGQVNSYLREGDPYGSLSGRWGRAGPSEPLPSSQYKVKSGVLTRALREKMPIAESRGNIRQDPTLSHSVPPGGGAEPGTARDFNFSS